MGNIRVRHVHLRLCHAIALDSRLIMEPRSFERFRSPARRNEWRLFETWEAGQVHRIVRPPLTIDSLSYSRRQYYIN